MRPMLASIVFLGIIPPAMAALEPEPKTPYQLRVVIRIADHPEFTEFFRRELKQQLQGNLQSAIGALGSVEVIDLSSIERDKWEPLWKQVEDKGLESLDTFNEIGGGKTHFLRVDYNNGYYDLQSRQVDGTAGFASPIVRKTRIDTRSFISRIAGLMIGQDFGVIATLEPGAGVNAFMRLKGGALGPADKWAKWVKKGEVFAVVQINQATRRVPPKPGTKGPATNVAIRTGKRVDGVLLRVVEDPRDGMVSCRVFNRYEGSFETRGVVGYRCVKLGTTEGPLRLQLIDPASRAALTDPSLRVYARAEDFPDAPKEAEQTIKQEGIFVSKDKFSNVAFIRVVYGARRLARIPIEIMDDSVQVRSIRLDANAEVRDRLDAERRGLITRITDGRLIQAQCFKDILAFEQEGKKPQAMERGQAVLASVDASVTELQDELAKFKARSTKELPGAAGSTADLDQQLLILQSKQTELRQHLEALKAAIAADNDPNVVEKKKKLQDILRRAELLATQANYDESLKAYEEALAEAGDDEAVKKQIDVPYEKLKKEWILTDGDAAHAEARKFIFDTWPKAGSLKDIANDLPNARKAFEKCKATSDRLAINKMQLAGLDVAARFGDELKKQIDSVMEEEDKKALEKFQKINEDLQKLLRDIQAEAVKGAPPPAK